MPSTSTLHHALYKLFLDVLSFRSKFYSAMCPKICFTLKLKNCSTAGAATAGPGLMISLQEYASSATSNLQDAAGVVSPPLPACARVRCLFRRLALSPAFSHLRSVSLHELRSLTHPQICKHSDIYFAHDFYLFIGNQKGEGSGGRVQGFSDWQGVNSCLWRGVDVWQEGRGEGRGR